MKKYRILILIILGLYTYNSHSQKLADNIQIINNDRFADFKINERVYLIADKDLYLAGEKIKLSVTTFDALLQIPVDLSKVVYIELINQENLPVIQEKIMLVDGKGAGSFVLPKDLESNYYYLRAYTNYMKNFGAEKFFIEQISIVNPYVQINPRIYNSSEENKVSMDLFPEGGQLIDGILTKIAVKISDTKGEKKDYYGIVTDNNSSHAIDSFTCDALGFGSFKLIPVAGHTYTAKIYTGNKYIESKLPSSSDKGALIKLDNIDSEYMYISIAHKNISGLPLQIKASQDIFKYSVENNIIDDSLSIKIPLEKLPKGFTTFSLLDNSNNTLSSRIVYIPQQEIITLVVDSLQKKYSTREKIDLKVYALNKENQQINSNLSVSVSLSEKDLDFQSKNYLLKSRLSSYFKSYSTELEKKLTGNPEFLQLALITCSVSDDTRSQTENIYFAETTGDIISGKVIDNTSQKPAAGKKIYQSAIDTVIWLNTSVTDSLGRFNFIIGNNRAVKQLVLRTADQIRDLSIILDDEFSNDYIELVPLTFFPEKKMLELIKKSMVNAQITEAYGNRPENISDTPVTKNTINFFGYADNKYYFDDYINLPTVEEFIFEIVREAIIIRRRKEVLIRLVSAEFDGTVGENPIFFVDGIPMIDSKEVLDIEPEKLEWIEVINHRYIYKDDYFDGIINIKTYSGNFEDIDMPKNSVRMNFNSPVNELTSYNTVLSEPDANIPDYKNVVYWNPYIPTLNTEKVTIGFYAPDYSGHFIIHCTGYDEDGNWFNYNNEFEVQTEE